MICLGAIDREIPPYHILPPSPPNRFQCFFCRSPLQQQRNNKGDSRKEGSWVVSSPLFGMEQFYIWAQEKNQRMDRLIIHRQQAAATSHRHLLFTRSPCVLQILRHLLPFLPLLVGICSVLRENAWTSFSRR